MILLDADILLIDLRYRRDLRFHTNWLLLGKIRKDVIPVAIMSQALLEVVGILSFNTSPSRVQSLPTLLCKSYGLDVVPDPHTTPDFAGCTFQDVVGQMSQQMASGDAIQAVQIERFAPNAECLISWNAKHFSGKLAVPAISPPDWLAQQNKAAH